jgi:hypothetical protein
MGDGNDDENEHNHVSFQSTTTERRDGDECELEVPE